MCPPTYMGPLPELYYSIEGGLFEVLWSRHSRLVCFVQCWKGDASIYILLHRNQRNCHSYVCSEAIDAHEQAVLVPKPARMQHAHGQDASQMYM